jgi:hypothetical protein
MAKRRKGPTLIQRSRGTSAQEKALYHVELGAGRARVKRDFLGLTPEDELSIGATVATGMDKLLKRQGL